MKKLKIIIIVIAFMFSARGDLIDYQLLDELNKEEVQEILDEFIPTAPESK